MTRNELIQDIQAYITSSFGIPPKLSEQEISRRIDDALRWFYREYDYATQSKYYMIPGEYFKTDEFKDTREVKVPDCVVSVSECREVNQATAVAFGEEGFSASKLVAADIFLSSHRSDDLVNRISFAAYYDLAKGMIKDKLRYKYNPNTRTLMFEGNPFSHVAIRTYIKIPEDDLFDDHYFIDYIRGLCLESMGRMLSIMEMQLPGGVKINADMLKTQGKEMIDRVKDEIDENQVSNYVEFYHGG